MISTQLSIYLRCVIGYYHYCSSKRTWAAVLHCKTYLNNIHGYLVHRRHARLSIYHTESHLFPCGHEQPFLLSKEEHMKVTENRTLICKTQHRDSKQRDPEGVDGVRWKRERKIW